MNQEEIKKKAANDQEEMKKANEDETIFSKKGLKELEKTQKLPPYFENLSKDIMINRKMKLILQKSNLILICRCNQHWKSRVFTA